LHSRGRQSPFKVLGGKLSYLYAVKLAFSEEIEYPVQTDHLISSGNNSLRWTPKFGQEVKRESGS
jgi:hypothetical protein